ncbi:phenylalanine--tRNA ligase subunit alpha [Xylanibacter rodentium]|jgi:phenylalanyl-tRNA synthetase alpha chain|uniref:Phenylalanine--tRNA ligase alpha subunit n=2 Tax=Xylanibacter rodentium TaxID=2736289 RepID=A0ABX2AQW9_9BACT|nr:phenylalanine--tRNA ligase subunit alpha [Xylanibacter rodentium]NPE10374.1 phenylalanine--tRNA ligase subunit alpha [Prevotella sp. PJ1A]NPE13015.1 phenylalanine--tRNA ligase subunit alpha [Xylanibacter rodentium]NPE39261.1 phenylalanine--tRNA ligase subunit alpha [Prevotella sp. PCJ2]
MILDKIEKLLDEVQNLNAHNAEEIEALRLKYLSKKGEITTLMADFRNVPAEQKKEVGMRINELKQTAIERINALKEQFETTEGDGPAMDLTRSPYPIRLGTRHPLTIVTNEIIDIFSRMGFVLADGPEVEDDLHVFTKMNFAADHPARDMQDTFFVEQSQTGDVTKNMVLRSHTSSVQARFMENSQPPIRIIAPGRVYRNEAITARAHCFFHQVEGLYVDKNVSFTDLKQVLLSFAREMFGTDTKIRLRPSYFPFTEPSAEMDISCHICGGKGCGFCKHTGWVEILGCGMVDPNVLEQCGIDSKVYSGYAFGMGVERITNLKYQVSDLRMFSENDTRFLKEFEAAN